MEPKYIQLSILQVPAHKSTITMFTENSFVLRMEFSFFNFILFPYFKVDMILDNLQYLTLLELGHGTRRSLAVPFNLSDSV